MSALHSPHPIQREIGLCTQCGKDGPIFLRYEHRKLCYACSAKYWQNSTVTKLRDHPLMTRKSGVCSWPPMWTTAQRDTDDKPTGEIGTLEQALMSDLAENKIFIFVLKERCRYIGLMQFDDVAFCRKIFRLLRANVGRSLKEIGDMDLSHLL